MTTNHPAHGPVSLDRLHQIREILSKAAAQSDGGNIGYAMADAVKVIDGAIAAMNANPVAWRYRYVHMPKTEEHGSPFTTEWKLCDSEDECNPSDCFERQPLYTAPPATVVDADDNFYSWFGREWEKYYQPNNYSLSAKKHLGAIAESAWFACRAALLQAGNSPATPDGWIPVSERMPEGSGRYWCYVEEQNCLGKSHYQWNCSWNGERWWVESDNGGRVTHWMELPAAPQQEVK